MVLRCSLVALVLGLSARADVTVATYHKALSLGGDLKEVAEAYVMGAGLALEAANAELRDTRHQPPLFCTPPSLVLNNENYESIIDGWIKGHSRLLPSSQVEKFPVYIVLMRGLIETFPCPSQPR
jgi:hypothetical protein